MLKQYNPVRDFRAFMRTQFLPPIVQILGLLFLTAVVASCERPAPALEVTVEQESAVTIQESDDDTPAATAPARPTMTAEILPTPTLRELYTGTPTPDPTRFSENEVSPFLRPHQVAFGETLSYIASLYDTNVEELLLINDLEDEDLLDAGQLIMVPTGETVTGPSLKLIPDSEVVYGPSQADFNVFSSIVSYRGYLSDYSEEVEGQVLSGAEIVQLVADRFSFNPRLLLAILEYTSGWVTKERVAEDEFPIGFVKEGYEGLYQQLSWAANNVNKGYYGRSEGGISFFEINDEYRVFFAKDINDGTAGLQLLFASFPDTSFQKWHDEIGPTGIYSTYTRLFGNPFSYTYDPLWPADLTQPEFILPFEKDDIWYFTGGPHGGWASGSAWAALDFTPSDGKSSCETSQAWVLAVADGVISRSNNGAVVLDLDGDGFAGTGWAVTTMHLAEDARVAEGSRVETGDRLGHPSCEGGFSNATHLHIARSYNGRWVSADTAIPLVMDGWISRGLGREYDGLLIRGDEIKEACQCEDDINAISGE